MLEQYALEKQSSIPQGWAPRVLLNGGVPPADVFNVYRQMYESQVSKRALVSHRLVALLSEPQVPPFNNQANVQFVSSDIATLLHDWITEALHSQSTLS